MSMKDLLNKMTELTGTQASTEVVSTTGKKVLTESKTEVKESKPSLKGIFNEMLNESTVNKGGKIIKNKKGEEVGEIYPLEDGDGFGYLHYKTDFGAEGMDTEEEAIEALNDHHIESLSNPRMGNVYEAEQITIQPAKQNTQVIKQGQKTLGTVENPQLAQQIKQSIGKGEMTLAGDELNEKWGEETKVAPSEKGKYEGKTKAELLKQYNALKSKGPHKKGSPDYGKMRELSFAIRAKSGWGKVDETDMGQADARKSAPSSKEEQEKVFSRTREKSRNLRAELDADPELLTKKVSESVINEKAVSKSQQQAAGAALAAKRGDAPKSKLTGASKEMAKMPAKELEKFAKTKHKGLPDKKKTNEDKGTPIMLSPVGKGKKDNKSTPALCTKHNKPLYKKGEGENAWRGCEDCPPQKTTEAAMPTHDGDFGAGLGAGRNSKTLESKKSKPDYIDLDKDGNKKESMKKAAADKQKVSTMKKTNEAKAKPDYIDLDKDGNKTEPMKKAAADKKKKAVKEGANPTEAARLLGKAHALGKDPFACKYEQGSPEAQAYLDGYKEGLDECYGSGGGMGMSQDMTQDIGMMPGMDSMVSMTDTQSPRGGSEFEIDSMDDVGGFGGFDDQPDEADMMAFEAWDRQLNELLNEDTNNDKFWVDFEEEDEMYHVFDENGKSYGSWTDEEAAQRYADEKNRKKKVTEGLSVSVSKGNQGQPDSVTVTAQDNDADALLAMIKQAGLGLFGGEEQSGYGAPTTPQMPTNGAGDIGDHDSMMSLIKKMTTSSNDYEDEESQDSSSDCGCDSESDSKALVVGEEQGYDDKEDESLGMRTGKEADKEQTMKDRRDDSYGKFGKRTDEDESEDQMEFEVAEANAPDSDQAETTADEDAEAEEDKALAGAMSGDEEEIDESEEELTEWANDAGYTGSENTKDNTFEEDIDFMTRVISGGLNGPKKDQTTLPHTKVKVDEASESILDWKKLSGIK